MPHFPGIYVQLRSTFPNYWVIEFRRKEIIEKPSGGTKARITVLKECQHLTKARPCFVGGLHVPLLHI